MLAQFQAKGLLKSGGRARTDSTHIIAAVRTLNRLECVGETLRAVLNDVAVVAPDWLRQQVTDDWFERYGTRIEESRLPKGEAKRSAYAEQIGADGLHLLHALYHDAAPHWLREIPTVEILRQTWVHQYYTDANGQLRWRQAKDLPPAGRRVDSPYDPEAHFGNKRSMTWTGYKVHLSETCEANALHLITHVETTPAMVSDVAMTEPIHQAFAAHQLLPDEHVVDAGYVDAELIVQSRQDFNIELMGPVRPDVSWRAQQDQNASPACGHGGCHEHRSLGGMARWAASCQNKSVAVCRFGLPKLGLNEFGNSIHCYTNPVTLKAQLAQRTLSDQAPRPKGGASSGQVGLADYRLLRDTCPSSEEDASIGGTAPKPCKNQDLSWGNLSPKPPNKDGIPPRPEDGASCHGLVINGVP
jgi:hypothetical protein